MVNFWFADDSIPDQISYLLQPDSIPECALQWFSLSELFILSSTMDDTQVYNTYII